MSPAVKAFKAWARRSGFSIDNYSNKMLAATGVHKLMAYKTEQLERKNDRLEREHKVLKAELARLMDLL